MILNILKRLVYIGMISILLLQGSFVTAQYPPDWDEIEIHTPYNTPVSAFVMKWDWLPEDKQATNDYWRNSRPNTEFIGDASWMYNCHGYTWHISEFGQSVWIDDRLVGPQVYKYWADGGYVETTMDQATKVHYFSGDHSAITIKQPDWVISKWGPGPLMKHRRDDCPSEYLPSDARYYAPATPPVSSFAVIYGGTGAEQAVSIQQTYDSGLIVAGNTTSFGSSGSDIWLMKLDRHGQMPLPQPTPDGDYLTNFGGTSAAAPQVSGVIALMLQANPNLTWRDVQQILLQTAFKNHPGDAEWQTNGANYPVNHQYGFGRGDVESLLV